MEPFYKDKNEPRSPRRSRALPMIVGKVPKKLSKQDLKRLMREGEVYC